MEKISFCSYTYKVYKVTSTLHDAQIELKMAHRAKIGTQ